MNIEEIPVRMTVEISLHENRGNEVPMSIGIYDANDECIGLADLSEMDMRAIIHGMSELAYIINKQHECNDDIRDQLSQLGFKIPDA